MTRKLKFLEYTLILIILLAGVSQKCNAQTSAVLRFGFGGVATKVGGEFNNSVYSVYPHVYYGHKTNLQYGISHDYSIGDNDVYSFSQEMIFDVKKYSSHDTFNNQSQDFFRLTYLSFPATVKLKITNYFNGLAGISPGFMIGNNYKHTDKEQWPYNGFKFDLLAGFELKLKNNMGFTVRYSHGLKDAINYQAIDEDGDFYTYEDLKFRTVYFGLIIPMSYD